MYLDGYCEHLKIEKKMSKNSVEAYKSDLIDFGNFIKKSQGKPLNEVTETDIIAFISHQKKQKKAASTLSRKIASVRNFYNYLVIENVIRENPTQGIKTPKGEKKEIEYLRYEEIEKLLEISQEGLIGIRNKALLEIMYATGLKAKEIIEVGVKDINLKIGFLSCSGQHGKARVVPVGRLAREATEKYIKEAREKMAKENEEALFVNFHGERMTRQGLWKILKECGEKANIEIGLTPNILRNSFAIHMLQNGADLKSMQELLGHEDFASTQIYEAYAKIKIKDVYDSNHPRAL